MTTKALLPVLEPAQLAASPSTQAPGSMHCNYQQLLTLILFQHSLTLCNRVIQKLQEATTQLETSALTLHLGWRLAFRSMR